MSLLLTVSGEGIVFCGRPSVGPLSCYMLSIVRPVTSILHHAISLHLLEGFQ